MQPPEKDDYVRVAGRWWLVYEVSRWSGAITCLLDGKLQVFALEQMEGIARK